MTTYSIYFENQSESTQNYALFSEVPKISSNVGSPIAYSNVFHSRSVANDGNWSIEITKTYYAWCGTAPQKLSPGIKVSTGNGKLASLGTPSANGSFEDTPDYTAQPGAYQIDTGTDFAPGQQNFVIGLGGVDGIGRMKPLATLEAPPNASVKIAPVTLFYLGVFDLSTGTVIDISTISKTAAKIDFSANPGLFGAIVTQDQSGEFHVKYTCQDFYREEVARRTAHKASTAWQFDQLKHYAQMMLQILDASTIDKKNLRFKCFLKWENKPTKEKRASVLNYLMESMTGYSFESGDPDTNPMYMVISHPLPHSLDSAIRDWKSAYDELPARLQRYTADPRVEAVNAKKAQAGPAAANGVAGVKTGQTARVTGGTVEGATGSSLEEDKQRAMELLEAKGLSGFNAALDAITT